MSPTRESLLRHWWQSLFPRTPDFNVLLNRQCELVEQCTGALLEYMSNGDDAHADKVIELERRGDAIRVENMTILYQTFATPYDREDIYRSIAALDEIVNYAKSTIREMRGLKVPPDEHTHAMAKLLHEGAQSLKQGYARLAEHPLLAEVDAESARRMERETEQIYRQALSELFDAQHYMETLTPEQQEVAESLDVLMHELGRREVAAVGSAVGFVLEIMKRREVYRHMSNAADRVVGAGNVLHDIVAKIA